jgi:hypothetical protein
MLHVSQCTRMQQPIQLFIIPFIFLSGAIMDMGATVEALVEAASLPMSVLIVGVGNDSFGDMEVREGRERGCCSALDQAGSAQKAHTRGRQIDPCGLDTSACVSVGLPRTSAVYADMCVCMRVCVCVCPPDTGRRQGPAEEQRPRRAARHRAGEEALMTHLLRGLLPAAGASTNALARSTAHRHVRVCPVSSSPHLLPSFLPSLACAPSVRALQPLRGRRRSPGGRAAGGAAGAGSGVHAVSRTPQYSSVMSYAVRTQSEGRKGREAYRRLAIWLFPTRASVIRAVGHVKGAARNAVSCVGSARCAARP